ncbi:site-specific integrase [Shewanella psychromarinicola]|uniref:Site-specific integrase n=1 Tax=Shewanella psychromarinicola TaxID=2487742 RepID=A0A3N4E8F7_9GAMM|nr:site-specific integrase [Shewanella psychromarinicola]AZG36515.1 site-specific integrase [Shewanella psychromarinicola]MCL1083126.1 site-specific integrase [Shewanella psychromarinicola]RPA34363.1 site-specific integrase [Shewanella psychromarinicola]
MYLYRAPNNVYFTRICLAKYLRDKGFPFDVKVSLLTRDRAEAVIRNIDVAGALKKIIKSIDHQTRINDFIRYVDEVINHLRAQFDGNETDITFNITQKPHAIPNRETKLSQHRETTAVAQAKPVIGLIEALSAFIISKQKSAIRPLSIKQLEQRTRHFIDTVSSKSILKTKLKTDVKCVHDITSADAMTYRDTLLTQGRSYKSNKEYLAAVFQFFKWCQLMNYSSLNPFESVTVGQKPKAKPNQGRNRWTAPELKRLIRSTAFNDSTADFKWVTLMMLYGGLRPSEACQLLSSDIKQVDGVDCIRVDDSGAGQRLKNLNAKRYVPIHKYLLELGFIAFVEQRKSTHTQLFDYKPVGIIEDWSKTYCKQLAKLQTEIGMQANQRPTSYGFRHTFIDEMKQLDISEHIVAQIVGHANPNITYSRYGKDVKVPLCQDCCHPLKSSNN